MRTMQEIDDNIRLVNEELARLKEEREKIGYVMQNEKLQTVFDQIQPGMFLRIGGESFSQFICVKSTKLNKKEDKWNGNVELLPIDDSKYPSFNLAAHDDGYTSVSIRNSELSIYIQINSEDILDEWKIITEIEYLKFLDAAFMLNMDAQKILKF